METTANTDFQKDDPKRKWIALLCFFVALTGSVLLYRDYIQSYESTGEVLATIERKDQRVRKRPSSSYVWQEATLSEEVRRKEYVRTGEGSAATVHFNNGKTLELGENSLILVDNTENLSLSFLQGTALVKEGGKDSKISKDESGNTIVEELSVQLAKPDNLETIISQGEKTEVHFSWTAQGVASKEVVLEISSSPEFKGKTTQVSVGSNNEGKLKFSAGKFYWRIKSAGVAVSAVKQFNVFELAKITPTAPNNTSVSVLSPKTQIKFKWNIPSSMNENTRGKFELELSSNEDFKNPKVIEIDPRTGFTTIQDLESGRQFWRIKSVLGSQFVTSTVANVDIKNTNQIDLKLENIKEGSVIQLEQDKPISVSWQSSVKSEEIVYELKLKQQGGSGTEKIIKTGDTVSPVFSLQPGFYEVSVSALVLDKVISTAKPVKISLLTDSVINIKSPEMKKKFEYWDESPSINMAWEKDPLVESGYQFKFEASDSVGFEKTTAEEVLGGKTEIQIKPKNKNGKTYWRVKLINPDGQTVKMSSIQQFEVLPFPPPEQPVVQGLESGGEIFKVETPNQVPVLVWNKADRANKYELQVFKVDNKNQPKLVLDKETTDLKLTLSQLEEGEYKFSVRAVDQLGRKSKMSDQKKFNVSYGNLLEAPESLTEEVQ
ncbi:MAG: hypothetical protein KA715_02240 [Xanthomonadaceae bacterium]|nr:hypothetical protein [Xanthomonadaceae bacterium]